MIDPFKFADREELLLVVLNRGLTWRDFRIEVDRRGSNFYYPRAEAEPKLDQAGMAADALVVKYLGVSVGLAEAYRQFATNLLSVIEGSENTVPFLDSFVFSFSAE
jgi:hypothetical protein